MIPSIICALTLAFLLYTQRKIISAIISLIIAGSFLFLANEQRKEQETWRNNIGSHSSFEAIVEQVLQRSHHGYSARLRVIDDESRFSKIELLAIADSGQHFKLGQRISCSGKLISISKPRNPGVRDMTDFHWRNHIPCAVAIDSVRSHNSFEIPFLQSDFVQSTRRKISTLLTRGIDSNSDEAKVILGVALGEKRNGDAVTDSFRNSGALHIFAVSGMNVGMVAVIIGFFLRLLGLRKTTTHWLLIPAVFFYAIVTGFSPPISRAAIMATIVLIGFALRKQTWALNTIALTSIVFLLLDTHLLFQPSFQLSYGLLFVFLTIGNVLSKKINARITHDDYIPKTLITPWQRHSLSWTRASVNLFAVSVLASITSTPLTLNHFQSFTPLSAITSTLVVPQSFGVLGTSIVSVIGGSIFPPIAAKINVLNAQLARLMLETTKACAKIPGSFVKTNSEVGEYDILVYDLQSANAVLINSPSPLMIDSGRKPDFHSVLFPSLYELSIRPKTFICTHESSDANGAAKNILERFDIVNAPKLPLEELQIDPNTKLRVLHKPIENARGFADDRSLVLQLERFGKKILFVSDIGFETEKHLLAKGINLKSDVLAMGRHSNDFCGLEEFIDAVAPKCIIASHASEPQIQGIPAAFETMIARKNIQLLHQGRAGAATIHFSNNDSYIEEFLTKKRISF